jgi:YidC/Oxa1 family membrane protein insertase
VGILNPLFNAVAWIVVQFHSFFSLLFGRDSGWSWGLSIVLLVVVIRVCLIPLFVKQIKATRNMQVLQPKIKELQKRYKNDRETLNRETMKLYRESGTNPFASCLPIIVQSPFFFALYRVLSSVANDKPIGPLNKDLVHSANRANFFGAHISEKFVGAHSINVQILCAVMIVLMSLSQFYTQRQLMVKNMSPEAMAGNPFMQQQKMLMYAFPVMFAVFGINFPIGVLLYWLTTNVWTMGQQMFVIRRNPTPGSLAEKELLARRKAKEERKRVRQGEGPDATAPGEDAKQLPSTQRQQPTRQPRSKRTAASAGTPPKQQATSSGDEGGQAAQEQRGKQASGGAQKPAGKRKQGPKRPASGSSQAKQGTRQKN